MPTFPDLPSIEGAVAAELERGDGEAALTVLQPVAHALASESGAGFRALVDRLPVSVWHRDPNIAAALGQSFRAFDAPRGAPGLAYFSAAEDAIAHAPETPAHCLALVLVGHAGALRSAGRLGTAGGKLAEAESLLAAGLDGPLPAVMEVRARCALEHGILDLHAGRHDRARDQLLTAHGLAPHLSRAEAAECAGALAVLDYADGDTAEAERHASDSAALVAGTSLERSGFAAPGYVAELLLAVDRVEVVIACAHEQRLIDAAANTEWEPYAALVSGAILTLQNHPAMALDRLADADRGFERWDIAGFGQDFTALVRASVLNRLDRGDEAWEILSRIPVYEHHLLCRGQYLAAQLLAGGDLVGADAALKPCEALGESHSLRSLAQVQLLRGAIAAEMGELGTSALSVDLAFIGMARSGSRLPLLAIPPGMLAALVVAALEREQSPEVRDLLEETRRMTEGAVKRIEPLSRRERLVLAEAERGATVAAIANAMFISPNTVKTHLRRIYRKLGVTTRQEAIRRARTLGLHEITRDSPVPHTSENRGTRD